MMLNPGDAVTLKGSEQLMYVLKYDEETKTISVWYYNDEKDVSGPATASGIRWECVELDHSYKKGPQSYEPGYVCILSSLNPSPVCVVNSTVSPFSSPATMVELVTFNNEGDLVTFEAPVCAITYVRNLDELQDA